MGRNTADEMNKVLTEFLSGVKCPRRWTGGFL